MVVILLKPLLFVTSYVSVGELAFIGFVCLDSFHSDTKVENFSMYFFLAKNIFSYLVL
jgi:hypothetical protein